MNMRLHTYLACFCRGEYKDLFFYLEARWVGVRTGGPGGREHYLPGLCLLLGAGAHPAHDRRNQQRDKQHQGTVALVLYANYFMYSTEKRLVKGT